MLKIMRKILTAGTVSEHWSDYPAAPDFRGELALDSNRCLGCGQCAVICPAGAITLIQNRPVIDNRACLFCGRCVAHCNPQALMHSGNYQLAECNELECGNEVRRRVQQKLGRSLAIRHVDAGSCNACDWEMTALTNPIYDIQQYGIDFVASPRHADMLMVTGTVTRNLMQALVMTYEATPPPRLVMAVGSCGCSGAVYGSNYAICGGVDTIVPVDVYVPGCPPRPQALLHGLLMVLGRL